jgi:hypothetical protein
MLLGTFAGVCEPAGFLGRVVECVLLPRVTDGRGRGLPWLCCCLTEGVLGAGRLWPLVLCV